jgi:hypothetical protein
MWDIRCTVDAQALPPVRTVVQFMFSDLRSHSRAWWLVNENGEVDLCPVDPGDEPQVQICTTLRTMTRAVPLRTLSVRNDRLNQSPSPSQNAPRKPRQHSLLNS